MKGSYLGLVVLALAVVAWNSGIVSSASVPAGAKPQKKSDDSLLPLKFIENTMADYVDLAEAYYAPAPNDNVREKRTLAVVRNLVNRTRSGLTAVRGLLRGNSGSSSGSGSQSFLSRVGDLFTRILTFFTRLWDRITGLFNRGGESGSSTGPFARLRTGISGLFARFTGGGGGGGGLASLFGRPTSTESYSEFVYSTEKTTSTTEKAENDFPPDSENDFPFLDDTKSAAAAVVAESTREGKSKDVSSSSSDKAAEVSGGYPDFIPFPGDSDSSDIGTRSAKLAPSPAIVPANLPLQRTDREARPYVVNSPDVLHLINGQRLVVVD